MKTIDIEVLNLSKLDPQGDLIIVNVYVGKMPPPRIGEYLERMKERLGPYFTDRGFPVPMFVPVMHVQGEDVKLIRAVELAVTTNDEIKSDAYEESMRGIQ